MVAFFYTAITKKFLEISAVIMGEITLEEFQINYSSPSQERVENMSIEELHIGLGDQDRNKLKENID